MLVAEAVPAVGVGAALITLAVLCAFVFLRGFVSAATVVVRALIGGVGGIASKIPFVGGAIGGGIHSIERRILHYLGNAALSLDHAIAWNWHVIALTIRWTGREIRGLAADTLHALRWFQHHYLPRYVGSIARPIAKQGQHAAALARQNALGMAHAAAVAAATATLPYWRWRRWADRTIGQTIPAEIAAVGAEAGTLARRVEAQAKRLSLVEKLLAALGVAAAVGIGLNKLGLGHLRCRNNRRIGKALCGLPTGLLEALLGGAIELFLVLDICRLARLATRAALLLEPELRTLVVIVDAALCGGTRQPPPQLVVTSQPWPTPTTTFAL